MPPVPSHRLEIYLLSSTARKLRDSWKSRASSRARDRSRAKGGDEHSGPLRIESDSDHVSGPTRYSPRDIELGKTLLDSVRLGSNLSDFRRRCFSMFSSGRSSSRVSLSPSSPGMNPRFYATRPSEERHADSEWPKKFDRSYPMLKDERSVTTSIFF